MLHPLPVQTCPDGQDAVTLADRFTDPPGPVAVAVQVIVPFQFAVATLDPLDAGLSTPEVPLLQEKETAVASVEDQDTVYCWPTLTLVGAYPKERVGASARQLEPFQDVPLAQPHVPAPLRT